MSSSILTSKQQEELHKAIISYLHSQNFSQSYQTFLSESGISDYAPGAQLNGATDSVKGKDKYEGLLEKKWNTVVRLQKKILDLESQIAQLSSPITPFSSSSATSSPLPSSTLYTLTSHRSPVTCVAFHPVWNLLATGSDDTSIKIWDLETGELETSVRGHTKSVTGVCWGMGAKSKADGEQNQNQSAGPGILVSSSADLTVKIWDPSSSYNNIKTLYGHDHTVSDVAWIAPSASAAVGETGQGIVVSGSRDGTIKIWDGGNGYCLRTITVNHADPVWIRTLNASDDGKWVVVGANDQVARIYSPSASDMKYELRGHEHVIECVTFVPVDKFAAIQDLISGSNSLNQVADSNTSLNSSSSSIKRKLRKEELQPGLWVLTGSRDKTIKLWSCEGLASMGPTAGGEAGVARCVWTFSGHDNWIRHISFHPSSSSPHFMSVSDDKTIKIWDLGSGRCIKTIRDAHNGFVTCCDWNVKGRVIATGGVDGLVKVWECR